MAASWEGISGPHHAEAVNVLYATDEGMTVGGNQLWHQDIDGASGEAEAYDSFGMALAAWSRPVGVVSLPAIYKQ